MTTLVWFLEKPQAHNLILKVSKPLFSGYILSRCLSTQPTTILGDLINIFYNSQGKILLNKSLSYFGGVRKTKSRQKQSKKGSWKYFAHWFPNSEGLGFFSKKKKNFF